MKNYYFKMSTLINLEKIAALLQSLSAEIAQKEKEDIDFYLSAGLV